MEVLYRCFVDSDYSKMDSEIKIILVAAIETLYDELKSHL